MPNVYSTNKTSSSITVSSWTVYYINKTNAQNVIVYDQNNNQFNAFQFYLNGLPWWYVLDDIQNRWVNDLSSIGYSLTPIVFPTVSLSGDWGSGNWLYANLGGANISILPGENHLIGTSGSLNPAPVTWDDTKKYATIYWGTYQGSAGNGRTEFSIIKHNGYLYAQNDTNETKYLYALQVAVCNDATVTVVIVYNSSNEAYNAFKCTVLNTDYYFVLDGVQSDWTDNLSSIDYSIDPIVLPSVSVEGDFGTYNWLMPQSGASTITVTMATNAINTAYVYGTTFNYDSGKSYGVVQWQTNPGTKTGSIEVAVVNNNGLVSLQNISSNTIYIAQAKVAVCSSSQVTIVTVYDNSNVPYNSFKYSRNGLDYYYVLDGTQTDWTNNLDSIGYHLSVVLPTVSVLNNLGVTTSGSDTPQTVASGGTSYNLKYWNSGGWYGNYEPFDNTKCYAIIRYGKESGVWLSPCGVFKPVDGSGNISAKNISQTSQVFRSAQIAVCSSNQAAVVPVYDSSNNAYNSFKYTMNNVDYYYVLDGTQTDWVSDLSSIGYSLTPVVVLPVVTLDNWVLPDTSSGITTIQGGSTAAAGKAGAIPREKVAFDNSCVYATTFWRHADNTFAGRVEIAPVNNSGYIGLYNTTNQALDVYWVNYAICSDSTTTVVTVYDSSNNAYNAFKYTASGTDYYYVLDETQTDWTDDLSSIGYHLPVVLPNVTIYSSPSTYCAFNSSGGSSVTINSGSSRNMVYYWSGNQYTAITYDSTKLYSIISYRNSGTLIGRTELSCFEYDNPYSSSNYLGVTNVSSQSITVDTFDYAQCSDSTATVVTVYDSFINAYNAFQYTINGTDYYYVLDGTQTDWTDDLGGIGYSLTQSYLVGYPASDKSSVSMNNDKYIYDDSGNYVSWSASDSYALIGFYTNTSTGFKSVYSSGLSLMRYSSTSSMKLHWDWNGSGDTVQRILYMKADSSDGTISEIALPTSHSGVYTDVLFDSLRYYANGTLSNAGSIYRQAFGATYTWYYGTITWEDRSIGDLSGKIGVSDPDGLYVQQSVFRIIFMSSGKITGYHPYDTGDSSQTLSQITSYTYNNGVHSITFFNTNDWITGVYAGRIQFRYLNGTTMFQNLSAFDLIDISSGSLSLNSSTQRFDMYNAWNGSITVHAKYT